MSLDISGSKFGCFTVLGRAGVDDLRKPMWFVRCDDCGRGHIKSGWRLREGRAKQCSCLPRVGPDAPAYKHGDSKTPEYRAWAGMQKRCYDPACPGYQYYGARNITVCERWINNYEAFLSDMGRRPTPDHSLDRINNDGNYEPGNCRWATRAVQNQNKRKPQHYGPNNRKWSVVGQPITINGVTYRSLTNACKALNFSRHRAMRKLGRGKSPDEAFGVVQ